MPAAPDLAVSNDDGEGDGRRLSVRVLVVALIGQLVLFGGLIALTVHGFPFIGGGDGTAPPHPRAAKAGAMPIPTVDRFDASAAMRLAKMQVSAGPRPAGSKALRKVAVKLRDALPDGHFEDIPGHPGLRNVVGRLPGPGPVIVVGAHYDTINRPKGFLGANDSAAAVGAVIEIARSVGHLRRPANAPGIRFVLFDGEEEPHPTDNFYRDALRGSKAYVQAHLEEVGAMVLLDYIGNKGLELPREGTSNEEIWGRVRAAAKRVGVVKVFPDDVDQSLFDDHTPFLRGGIPAVDLIDWSYPYQHKLSDSYDKLSGASVDAVGETIVELLRTWPAG